MASYDFICSTCGEKKMIIASMRVQTPAPVCCNAPMLRIYNAPGITFKGTGWAGKEK